MYVACQAASLQYCTFSLLHTDNLVFCQTIHVYFLYSWPGTKWLFNAFFLLESSHNSLIRVCYTFPPSVNNTYFVFFTNILQFLGPINLKTIYSIFNFMLGGKNCLESYRVVMHILFYVYVFFYLLFSPGIATYSMYYPTAVLFIHYSLNSLEYITIVLWQKRLWWITKTKLSLFNHKQFFD